MGISKRISAFLADENFNFLSIKNSDKVSGHNVLENIEKGKIPIGRVSSTLWNTFQQSFQKIPLVLKESKEKFDGLTTQEIKIQMN